MKNIRTVLLVVMLLVATTAKAQYTQDKPNVEFMFKVEAGYLHNVGNYGKPEIEGVNPADVPSGYRLNLHEEAAGLNVMAGVNISQDFFLGDMDFRPVGDDWAPMVGARVGGSFLMNPGNYGNTISPYLELYGGLNWFYDHALQQMDRNYHSLFVEVGIVLEQQTVFIPLRVGWRW